jgi:hypothetical protein
MGTETWKLAVPPAGTAILAGDTVDALVQYGSEEEPLYNIECQSILVIVKVEEGPRLSSCTS